MKKTLIIVVVVVLVVFALGAYLKKAKENKVPVVNIPAVNTDTKAVDQKSTTVNTNTTVAAPKLTPPPADTSDININPADLDAAMGL